MKIKATVEYIRHQKEESLWGVAELMAPPSFTERLLAAYPKAFRDSYMAISMVAGLSFPAEGVWPCSLVEGMEFSIEGDFKKSKWGWQFKFVSAIEDLPTTNESLIAYLQSGLVKGIGTVLAGRIFAKFTDPLVIFEQDIDSLLLIEGIGEKKLEKVKASWEENGQMRNFIGWAVDTGRMTTGLAVKCFKKWGGRAQYEIETNPWVIATLPQVGFAQADLIAFNLGHENTAPKRIEAGMKYILGQAESPGGFTHSKQGLSLSVIGGQSFLPKETLIDTAAKMLEVEEERVTDQIDKMLKQGQAPLIQQLYQRGGGITLQEVLSNGDPILGVYLTKTHKREVRVAARLKAFQQTQTSRILAAVQEWGSEEWGSFFEGLVGITLTDEQQAAVQNALGQKVSILTGGPGVGKTFVSKFIVDWLKEQGMRVILATPTGKASKVLSQATGQQASTIHRLLGFTGNKFTVEAYDETGREGLDEGLQPVPDMIIIDETSMVDLWLIDSLLMRVSKRTHILFVGDEDQLPSVGAGFVLGDMIAGGAIPVSRLTKVHRQAEHSAIIKNARLINAGQTGLISRSPADKHPDFFIATIRDRDRIVAEVVDMVTERIPDRFGYRIEDIQILTPRNGGETGINSINRRMQAALNPPSQKKAEYQAKTRTYRVGDPIMQIKNTYGQETFIAWDDAMNGTLTSYSPDLVDVFNGDQGVIVDYARDHNGSWVFVVEIDGYRLGYSRDQISANLVLSHAITCHKSQGGQFPVVVMVLTWEHWALLQRKLLYTAITRAKEMVVLVCQPGKNGELYSGPLGHAIRNNKENLRHTALDWRLKIAINKLGGVL